MTEKQLIEGCQKDDNYARKRLYELYAKKMFALCYRYVNDYDVAQDLLQDGYLKVFERIRGYSSQGSFEGWMKRVFVNTTLDYLRKQKTNINIDDLPLATEMNDDEENKLENTSNISEKTLLSMLKQLPKGYATVFNMLVIEEYSQKEVAAMLQITESGVRSQYARARKLLMKMVQDYQIKNG